jgi:hypothetical protein
MLRFFFVDMRSWELFAWAVFKQQSSQSPPPDLHLPSSWEYRHELLCPGVIVIFQVREI